MKSQMPLNTNEHLHLLTIKCPDCKMMWFAPGVGHGDNYVCKECGLGFVVWKPPSQTFQPSAEDGPPETPCHDW